MTFKGVCMKKIVKYLLFIFIICLCFNKSVFSYEISDSSHEDDILRYRQEIYDYADSYRDIFSDTNMGITSAYYGVCSNVKVNGKTYTLEEYVAGVVNAEVGAEYDAYEALKAHAIAARSYLLKTNDCKGEIVAGQSYQGFKETTKDSVYYKAAEETAGMIVTINGDPILTEYTSYPNAIFTMESNNEWIINFQRIRGKNDTAWTWTGPSKQTVLSYNNYKPQTGAPSTTHHFGMSSVVAVYLDKAKGYTYDQILKLFYGNDISIDKMSDGSYIGDLVFVNGGVGDVFYFNQLDYTNYYYSTDPVNVIDFADEDSVATIASHGCGPTSLAIVVSTFLKSPHGPIETTAKVCQVGGCTDSGSYASALKTVAEQYGLQAYYTSDPQTLINELGSGNAMAIALMGPGVFTFGGHFITLTDVNSQGMIGVADPASRQRTAQKWFDLNIIMEQKKSDFIIIKR